MMLGTTNIKFYLDILSFKDYMTLIFCEWNVSIELCMNDNYWGGPKNYPEKYLSQYNAVQRTSHVTNCCYLPFPKQGLLKF